MLPRPSYGRLRSELSAGRLRAYWPPLLLSRHDVENRVSPSRYDRNRRLTPLISSSTSDLDHFLSVRSLLASLYQGFQGHRPSISTTRDQLKNIRTTTKTPTTAMLERVGSSATVRITSTA